MWLGGACNLEMKRGFLGRELIDEKLNRLKNRTGNKKECSIKNAFSRGGFLVIHLMMTMAAVTTLLGGLLNFVATTGRRSSDEVSAQKALSVAETGIYFYKWYLAHNLDGKNAQQIRDFWEAGTAYGVSTPYEHEVTDLNDENPIGKYKIEVEIPNLDSTIVNVTSTGWTYRHPTLTKSIRVRFRRPSWSESAVIANDVMRFGSGTNVSGPIHSNNGIRFDGVANNIVSSAVEEYYDPDTNSTKPGVWTAQSNENEVFLAGKEFPVTAIDFNGVTTDLAVMKVVAQQKGIFLEEDFYDKEICEWTYTGPPSPYWENICNVQQFPIAGYHLILRVDDKVEVRKVYEEESDSIILESEADVFSFPGSGLIFGETDFWVDGQIDTARLTIASAKLDSPTDTNIFVNNDLKYTNYNGQDVIGLVAEDSVLVGLHSDDYLEINAAMLAQKGMIGREDYGFVLHGKRESLDIFGSLATNRKYVFNYAYKMSVLGYEEMNFVYDNNLSYNPPPFFPTIDDHSLSLWENL